MRRLLEQRNKKGEGFPPPFLKLKGRDGLNILAIDQARNGAWSVFDYEDGRLLDYGVFSYDASHYTYSQAILAIEELMDGLIKDHNVDAVFIEDIQFRTNINTLKKLAHLQGVLINLCERNHYLYGLVAPSQWQNFCKSYDAGMDSRPVRGSEDRKKSKQMSIQFVSDVFNIETGNDNLADAICIGWYVVKAVEIDLSKGIVKKKAI